MNDETAAGLSPEVAELLKPSELDAVCPAGSDPTKFYRSKLGRWLRRSMRGMGGEPFGVFRAARKTLETNDEVLHWRTRSPDHGRAYRSLLEKARRAADGEIG